MKQSYFEGKIFDLQADQFSNIPNVFLDLEKDNLTHYAKWCWVLLKKYAGANGKVIPKNNTLAAKLICSEKSAREAVNELKEKGYIVKFTRYFKSGKYKGGQISNGYVMIAIDLETGKAKELNASYLRYVIDVANEIEDTVEWKIDCYYIDKYNLEEYKDTEEYKEYKEAEIKRKEKKKK